MKLRLLRLLLFASAFAWAVSVVGVILPWPVAVTALQGLGAGNIPVYGDTAFCLLVGAGIWMLRKEAVKEVDGKR